MNKGIIRRLAGLFVLSCFPVAALAHTGVGATSGFAAGFSHPLAGLDHMLAMIAVGMWAAQLGGRALWLVPMSFVLTMMLGGALGMAHIHLPLVEQGIMVSVLVLGVMVAAAFRLSAPAGALLVAVFAVFHGHAHGTEMPMTAAGLSYGAGFALATAMLHVTGIGFGTALQRFRWARMVRLAGAVIVVSGLYTSLS